MFCKISICMFLLRIKNTRWNRRFMYWIIGLNVAVTIVTVSLFIGICSPPAAYWTVGLNGRCFSNERIMAIVISQGSEQPTPPFGQWNTLMKHSVFSALSDIVLATTPLIFLKDLHISLHTKICLCILMGAGYMFVTFDPCLRCVYPLTVA